MTAGNGVAPAGGVLVVTGASRGIGAAVARMAGARGYAVCVNYKSASGRAAEVVADITEAGSRAVAVQADMASEDDIVRLFETTDRALGPATALVNNAGITGPNCLIEDVDGATLETVFRTNVAGYFLCAREAIKRMSVKNGGGGGAIVNVSSVAALLSNAFEWVHYGASKAAVDTFTMGLALEAAEHGIRANGVRPGPTVTDLLRSERDERLAPTIPLKRAAMPDEIAEAILWLL
ncbi:MAG: SDR family NAD(P)-dependent oxidoreductase, partial [Alphaproteobacteria bacterium]|nr:SDR family NAD(P)-dependent oxidoreductase [Alphaproteobacteria bacterium]